MKSSQVRGPKTPVDDLETIVDIGKRVLWPKEPFSNDEFKSQLVNATGQRFPNRIRAAFCYFNLVEFRRNLGRLTSLGKAILLEDNSENKKDAIVRAALSPVIYQRIVNRLKGKPLPSNLEEIFISDFKYLETQAQSAVDVFQRTMKYAGLLRNGILFSEREVNKVVHDNKYREGNNIEKSIDKKNDGQFDGFVVFKFKGQILNAYECSPRISKAHIDQCMTVLKLLHDRLAG